MAVIDTTDVDGITITPQSPTIGAQIDGLDLSAELSDDLIAVIHRALLDWKVLFFRGQDITTEQHLALARPFGDLEVHPFAPHKDGYPEVLAITHDTEAAFPEYQVRFRWAPNSIAFWDNRACQHYAVSDYWPSVRRVERVTIIGDTPYDDPDQAPADDGERPYRGAVKRWPTAEHRRNPTGPRAGRRYIRRMAIDARSPVIR